MHRRHELVGLSLALFATLLGFAHLRKTPEMALLLAILTFDTQQIFLASILKAALRYCCPSSDARSRFVCDSKVLESRRANADSHGMFNHSYFARWFRALLDQLASIGKGNVIIVLDNASYHKGLPDDIPKSMWS
ncbi:hypothetical protein ACHHYP_20814 [Achlya hypogyna]|uniref:Tc1-like transposase DDE domain-containing protein n=1 Tax=Achlya hypogyna TaxID=1202772 RepID=A0A1V9Y8T4_ACHHY|nr:hypothetical protein ACHHYP_20814 [Achlya hypogyna]